MIDLGIIKPGTTIYVPFGSYAGSTGASAAMTGLATSDILVYKDGSTTERASTSGFTLLDTDGLDFDGKTGINGVSIDLADNTTAGFWAAGSRYWVVIGDVTVDSQTVRFIAATFTIGLPAAVLNTTIATLASQTSFTLTAGPAEDDALNGCLLYIHDVASAVQGGFALVSDYTGSTKTVTLAAGTTFTAAASDNVMVMPPRLLPTVAGRTLNVGASGHALADLDTIKTQTITCAAGVTVLASVGTAATSTAQTGDAFARLGAPAGASVSADVAAVKSDTAAILVDTGTDGVVVAAGSKTGYSLTSAYDFAKGTTAMTEAYAANGAAPTPVEAIFAIHQYLMQFGISSTNYTVKKLDNSTTAFTVTLDDATTPSAAART